MPAHRTYSGKIAYLHDTAGETGREWFSVSVHGDGSRIVRARCEMDDDHLLRDVVIGMDATFRPTHAHVHLVQHDRFLGSGWFKFTNSEAVCEADTVKEGRISQSVALTEPVRFFGTHPIVCDGLMPALFDFGRGERRQRVKAVASSMAPNGASGPTLSWFTMDLEYVRDETITVRAGTFDTRHFLIHLAGTFDAPLEVWVHGPDCLVVREAWTILKSRYELVEVQAG